MLSKATIRLVHSLDTRKGRRLTGLFVAEGPKLVGELLGHFRAHSVFCTPDQQHLLQAWQTESLSAAHSPRNVEPSFQETSHQQPFVQVVSEEELSRISLQKSPQGVVALMHIPTYKIPSAQVVDQRLCIALDGVQDPGNLGTIVRLADWFGVEDILCSPDTCDIWNPKAVQATMGGLARVRVHYLNICDLLSTLPPTVPVYGTSLSGQSLYTSGLEQRGVLVMGNEGRGVSPAVSALCRQQLLIPNYPPGRSSTDSLNVAMATAITLAEFRRRTLTP